MHHVRYLYTSTGTVLHDCKLKADLKTPYIVHRTFPLPCFNETMSNDDVCAGINLPRVCVDNAFAAA